MPHMAPMLWLLAPLILYLILSMSMYKSHFSPKPLFPKMTFMKFKTKWNW